MPLPVFAQRPDSESNDEDMFDIDEEAISTVKAGKNLAVSEAKLSQKQGCGQIQTASELPEAKFVQSRSIDNT